MGRSTTAWCSQSHEKIIEAEVHPGSFESTRVECGLAPSQGARSPGSMTTVRESISVLPLSDRAKMAEVARTF